MSLYPASILTSTACGLTAVLPRIWDTNARNRAYPFILTTLRRHTFGEELADAAADEEDVSSYSGPADKGVVSEPIKADG